MFPAITLRRGWFGPVRLLWITALIAVASARSNLAAGAGNVGYVVAAKMTALRSGDELWTVGTRQLGWPACNDAAPPDLELLRYDGHGGWKHGTMLELREPAPDPDRVTMIFVHGYRSSNGQAFANGWSFYQALARSGEPAPPVRLILWSWPSEQTQRLLRDVRAKGRRTDAESWYLAWFLSQLDPDTKLSLAGFSYGGRIVTGALHLWAGGELDGLRLAGAPTKAAPVRAVLFAPALHSYWLAPGEHHGCAYSRLDAALNLYSPCDWALKHYHWVDRCTRSDALGATGVVGRERFADQARRIVDVDVTGYVGSAHTEELYLEPPELAAKIRSNLFWQTSENKPNHRATEDTE
jgi:hypothetical protein